MDYRPQIEELIRSNNHRLSNLKPSEWTELNRVMKSAQTSLPGKFKYSRTPYLKEPLDCMSQDSDVRVIAVMKGSQIGFSTGVIESAIGWIISQQPGNIMLLARDESMVKRMMERKIDPMIDGCGIRHLIRPNVLRKKNARTGDTSMSKEFPGGGLFAGSVQTPDKMRQDAVQFAFIDDFEAAPRSSKEAGDTTSLIETRLASFYHKMKLWYISTPETKQTSNIEPVYLLGDQRKYLVPCPLCGDYIELVWEIDFDGGKAGMTWKLDSLGRVKTGSTKYMCQSCGGKFSDKHKYDMNLAGEWKATAEPSEPGYRSYHISSLYSGPGTYTWEHYARMWMKAHPVGGDVLVDKEKTFYNTCLGLTYEEFEKKLDGNILQNNQRPYKIGLIPQSLSISDGNGPIALITCGADMNGNEDDARLDYEIVAWSVAGPSYSITHGSIGTFIPNEGKMKKDRKTWTYREGKSNSVWPAFKKVIEQFYIRDTDGGNMKVLMTGLDTGYYAKYAYRFLDFCNTPSSLIGVKGKGVKDQYTRENSEAPVFKIAQGRSDLYLLDVSSIKDDIANHMEADWDSKTDEGQPYGFMNFPQPADGLYSWSNFFSHYEAEEKQAEKDKYGNVTKFVWKNTKGKQNHLWDCRVYNNACREIFINLVCRDNKVKNPDWRKYLQLIGLLD